LALANAVVPEMMRQGWGRIVNVTTEKAGAPVAWTSIATMPITPKRS
jgi:NAD(P)-dependent dehydrogenase (short-subunit alcohol dehydrogenase family)